MLPPFAVAWGQALATTVPRSSPSYSNPGWSAGGGESPRLRRRGEGAGALPAGRMPPADLRFESWPLSRTHMGRGIWTAVSCQSRRSKEAEGLQAGEARARVRGAGGMRGGLCTLGRRAAMQVQGIAMLRESCWESCAIAGWAARGA